METDQAEQLDTLLSQSVKALNKNQDTEKTDASTISKWGKVPLPFWSPRYMDWIANAKKKDTDLTLARNKPTVIRNTKSVVLPQKGIHSSLTTTEEQL